MGKNIASYTDDLQQYLTSSDVINFTEKSIVALAEDLYGNSKDTMDYIKNVYEYVRDQISHSADINQDVITCSASEVLAARHGICFAKSHLLAAVLRYKGGVNSQFSVEEEQLAFPIRTELGEEDNLVVYPEPDKSVLEKLKKYKTRTELFDNLPTELAYSRESDVTI